MAHGLKVLRCNKTKVRRAVKGFKHTMHDLFRPKQGLQEVPAPIGQDPRMIGTFRMKMKNEVVFIVNVTETDEFRRNIATPILGYTNFDSPRLPVPKKAFDDYLFFRPIS